LLFRLFFVDKVIIFGVKMEHEVTTVNPKFGHRSWVKLWVNEWLDGTTRYEMSDSQRAFWIDLLAMAGRSRYPGIICAGKSTDGKYIGYPINKFQSLMSEPLNVEETLAMFERTGKITVNVTPDSPLRLLTLELLNWDKYQSEYNRQKPYRKRAKLQQSDPHSYNQGNNTDTETDTETEVDGEIEVEKPFGAFWNLYPRKVGRAKAEKWWNETSELQRDFAMKGLLCWKRAEQWNRDDGKYIPYASTFLAQKRYLDEPWTGAFAELQRSA
jgi:hypothetical protein